MISCWESDGGIFDQLSESVLECDYDKNVTNLYQSIESGAWSSVQCFFETEKWSYMHFTRDATTPSEQARTWVTRFESDGEVRWSQLPLHAAVIFQAPRRLVQNLIELYPLSVRCTDDQGMLPLHLAFRVGADDMVMNLLIKSFPEALVTQNERGLVPYKIVGTNSRKEYNESIQQIVKHISRKITLSQEKLTKEKTDTLEDAIGVQSRVVKTLEMDNDKLEIRLSKATREITKLEERCRLLQKMIAAKNLPKVTKTITTGSDPLQSILRDLNSNDTEASTFQTNASSVTSSVTLNSVQFRKESIVSIANGNNRLEPIMASIDSDTDSNTDTDTDIDSKVGSDIEIGSKLQESAETFTSAVSKRLETRADEDTSSMHRIQLKKNHSTRSDLSSKSRRTGSSSSQQAKPKMISWCDDTHNISCIS